MLPVHIRSCSLYRSIRGLDPAAAFLFSHSDPCKIFPVLSARFRSRMASFRQLVIPARFFSLSHPVKAYAKLEIRNIPAVFRHDKSFLPGQSSRFQCLAVPEFRIRIPLSGKEPPSKITAEFRSRNSFRLSGRCASRQTFPDKSKTHRPPLYIVYGNTVPFHSNSVHAQSGPRFFPSPVSSFQRS